MNDNATLAMASVNRSGLGGLPQRLVQDGVVDEATMLAALAEAKERRVHVVTQLINRGSAQSRDIAIAAATEFGAPLLDLDAIQIDIDVVRIVSDKLIAKHRVLPLYKRGKRLFLGVNDPTNLHAIDEIKFQTGLSVEAVVVEDDKLQALIDKSLEQAEQQMPSLGDEEGVDLENLEVTGGEEELDAVTTSDVEDAPIVRFVNKVMLDAIRRGASDIHFEPYERMFRVRFRIDGVLKEIAQPPVQLATKICARLKVMSRLDIAERRVPQDGRIKMKLSKTRAIDFRVS
ncbi:MAG: ATPase, T2SS/T4P/T4SS family, partial [Gammaproteobacteria bacterium]|nr:ATPase, T2SS/T4P/T4SS family [Gammaproteobacteria bacterium]